MWSEPTSQLASRYPATNRSVSWRSKALADLGVEAKMPSLEDDIRVHKSSRPFLTGRSRVDYNQINQQLEP